jgi:putative heme-binding domain-containing protein
VGFVAMITPSNYVAHPVAVPSASGRASSLRVEALRDLDTQSLVELLRSPSDALRLASGRALALRDSRDVARRADALPLADALVVLAKDRAASLNSRIAAVWTLRQANWNAFKAAFGSFLIDADLREHVIRAAADRKSQMEKGLFSPIFSKLDDSNPRVRAAAIVAMGRFGDTRAAKQLLALTERTQPTEKTEGDAWRKADPGRVIPHLAIKALTEVKAIDACLEALNGPLSSGAIATLKQLHDPKTVDGLFKVLSTSRDESLRREVWTTLIRLYHREGEFTLESPKWWGTRPDTTGPYYDRQKWSESDRIAEAVKVAMAEADESLKTHLTEQLKKHVVNLDGLSADVAIKEEEKAIVLPKADPNDPNAIANLLFDVVATRAAATHGDVEKGRMLFRQQSCINCHTFANGQQPKGPHLVDIGKRYKRAELIESIVQPGKKIAQGFDTWAIAMDDGKIYTGFIVLESAETVTLRDATGISHELIQDQIEDRVKQEISMMPQGIVGNLSPEQLADLLAYLESLR